MSKNKRWLAPLFFLLIPLVPLWKTLFLGQGIGPLDEISQMAPWNGPMPSKPWDVLQADGVLQFLPWRDLVLDAWSKHQIPLWNNYELAGTPLLANSQSGGFYPPHIVLGLLQMPTLFAMVLLAWFHLGWAGLGTYRLCRDVGGSRLGGMIAGIGFCLSPFMLSWTALASVITTVAWIPWLLALSVELSDRDLASRQRIQKLGWLGAISGMMLLGGHLQFSFYGLLSASLLSTAYWLSGLRNSPRAATSAFATTMAGLLLGVMLSAAQLYPVTQFAKLSNRQNIPSETGYQAYIGSAIQPFELGSVANPVALGFPRDSIDEQNPGVSTYWPLYAKIGANYAESAICIGPIILVLLGLVKWRAPKIVPLFIVSAITLLMGLGTSVNRVFYFGIPGWSATGSPGRVIVMFVLLACVLAGSGITETSLKISRRTFLAPGLFLLVGVFCSLYSPLFTPNLDPAAAKTVETIQAAGGMRSLVTLLSGVLIAVIALLLLTLPKLTQWRAGAVALTLTYCGLFYASNLVTTGTPLRPVSRPPSFDRVAYRNHSWGMFQASRAIMPPNLASLNRIHEIGGYDSLLSGETVLMLKDLDGDNPAPPVNGNMMLVKDASIEKLRQAGVSSIGKEDGSFEPIPNALGRVSLTNGTASITSEDYSSVTIQADGNGILTLRDRMMPGWTADIDGQPVQIRDGTWREIKVETPAHHLVHFRYNPPGLKPGLVLSLFACFAVLGCLGAGRRVSAINSA